MGFFRRARNRWNARRRELAMKQVEADHESGRNAVDPLTAAAVDAFTGQHVANQYGLGRLLNPKATTRTEWRGD